MVAASVAAAQSAVSFVLHTTQLAPATSPIAVATGDFNADQKLDLAVADNDSGDVTVLLGNADGSFVDPGASFPIGMPQLTAPSAIAVADVNGDGAPDLVVADEFGDSVSVLLNQPQTLFGSAIISNTGTSPEAVVVADFDGDGIPDIATADSLDNTVSVLQGNNNGQGKGDGTFVNRQPIQVGSEPVGLVAVDIDGDHNMDLVVANYSGGSVCSLTITQSCRTATDCPTSETCETGNGSVTILKGLGHGTFQAVAELSASCSNQPGMFCTANADCPTGGTCTPIFNAPSAITVTDLNKDKQVDLVISNEQGDSVTVLLGNGDFSFQAPITTAVGSFPESVVAADFDGDGKMDIATSDNFDDNVSVLIGLGNGTFMPDATFPVGAAPGAAPWGIAAADFNKDGRPDLVTANMEEDSVSVLLNTPVSCTGDCNGNHAVTVDEILTMVNIALGNAPLAACSAGDANQDMTITIDEILAAVNNALTGCPV
ncbi:MAG: FG-GAP repeat domain-containing protein [Candidatus Binatia bacterium]